MSVGQPAGYGRLIAWLALVGALAALGYASRAAGGEPPDDVLYRYETAIAATIQYGFVFAVVLLICRGWPARTVLALRRPNSWKRAAAISLGIFVVMFVLGGVLSPFLDAGEEQGLTPDNWQSDRAGAFVANALVVVGIAPVVEELTYRGLGYALLARFGQITAVILVGLIFGLGHGLIIALPILTAFGIGLTYLRSRTDSIYPPIVLHAFFNAFSLTLDLLV